MVGKRSRMATSMAGVEGTLARGFPRRSKQWSSKPGEQPIHGPVKGRGPQAVSREIVEQVSLLLCELIIFRQEKEGEA